MELERNTRSKSEVQVIFDDASEAGLFGSVRFHPLDPRSLRWNTSVAQLSQGGDLVVGSFSLAKLRKIADRLLSITPSSAPAYYAGEHLPTGAAQEQSYRTAQRLGGEILSFVSPPAESYQDR